MSSTDSQQVRNRRGRLTSPRNRLGRAFESLTEGPYWAYALIAPSLMLVGAVVLYPVIDGILLSFRDYRLNRPALGMPWIGTDHYRRMLQDPIVHRALKNTVVWVVIGALSQFVLGLVAALALNRSLPGMRAARVLVLIPWLLPSVVSANMWRFMLDARLGVINDILTRVGLLDHPRAWFAYPGTALYEVLALNFGRTLRSSPFSCWPDCTPSHRSSMTRRAWTGAVPGGDSAMSPYRF